MDRIVFVDGEYVSEHDAKVSIFDRGFLFADGVYEVCAVLDGRLVDYVGHMNRLQRSLGCLSLHSPLDEGALLEMHRQLIVRNSLQEGLVYMQVTRGNPRERDFTYPDPELVTPTIVAFTRSSDVLESPVAQSGVKAITLPDIRWARRDIKSIALLPQAMAKQAACEAGVDVAWMVEDGFITEEAASSAFIVKDDTIIVRPVTYKILSGITRRSVLSLLKENDHISMVEREFTVEEAYNADEAFITSATSFVTGVVEIDGKVIGSGDVGRVTKQLRELYIQFALNNAI